MIEKQLTKKDNDMVNEGRLVLLAFLHRVVYVYDVNL